jgi:hypothetical protein
MEYSNITTLSMNKIGNKHNFLMILKSSGNSGDLFVLDKLQIFDSFNNKILLIIKVYYE